MTHINRERLYQRGYGRKQARDILSLLDLKDPNAVDAFLDELRSVLSPKKVEEESKGKVRKLRELSTTRLDFGQYAGELLENIPRPYLHWLAGEQEQLSKTIHEYLALTAGEDEEEET